MQQAPQMSPNAWRDSMTAEEYQAAVDADLASEACTSAKTKFAYQYGASTDFLYSDWGCVEIPVAERVVKTGNTIVYFPSFFDM